MMSLLAEDYYFQRRFNDALESLEPAVMGLKTKVGERQPRTLQAQELLEALRQKLQNSPAQSEVNQASISLHDATVEQSQGDHQDTLVDSPSLHPEASADPFHDALNREPG